MAALSPYVRNRNLWQCPSDTGYDVYDATGQTLNGRPTSFIALGTSYLYRTELSYSSDKPDVFSPRQLGSLGHPVDINVLYDAWGWHGAQEPQDRRRYNILYADWHVKNIDRGTLVAIQHKPL